MVPQNMLENIPFLNVGDVFDGWEVILHEMEELPCGAGCCGYSYKVTLRSPDGEQVVIEK